MMIGVVLSLFIHPPLERLWVPCVFVYTIPMHPPAFAPFPEAQCMADRLLLQVWHFFSLYLPPWPHPSTQGAPCP